MLWITSGQICEHVFNLVEACNIIFSNLVAVFKYKTCASYTLNSRLSGGRLTGLWPNRGSF
jgi:hypothetical protein